MTLWLPVGIPGTGKSTLADKLTQRGVLDRDAIVSPDEYREIMCGDRMAQHENPAVFNVCYLVACTRMRNSQDVWFDATNLNPARQLLHCAEETETPIKWVRFDTTEEQAHERNRRRIRPVPEHAMQRMIDRYLAIQWETLPGEIVNADTLERA